MAGLKAASSCGCTSPSPLGILLNGHYAASLPPRKPRKPKNKIPESLRDAYADVLAKAKELREQGLTHAEVCDALNKLGYRTRTGKPWRHPQQIIKLLRSFGSG